MRAEVRKHFSKDVIPAMPKVIYECEKPDCDHKECFQDPADGKWYVKKERQLKPKEDELELAMMAMQTKHLSAIRQMLVFMTTLIVIGLIVGAIAAMIIFYQ